MVLELLAGGRAEAQVERWKSLHYNQFMELPQSVRTLLSEYDLREGTDGAGWQRAAVERVMSRGRWEEMRWLLAAFDRDRLRSYLGGRGRRALSPRELRFWCMVCEVPPAQADVWVAEARSRERAWRG